MIHIMEIYALLSITSRHINYSLANDLACSNFIPQCSKH